MIGWWNSLPVFFRYIALICAVSSLILLGYFGFVVFQKIFNKGMGHQRTSQQDQTEEVDPSIIEKIELRSVYKCYKIFQPDSIIFDQPIALKINLKANKVPLRKGRISFELLQRFESNGRNRLGMSTGPGPFGDMEILPLNPWETRKIKMTVGVINYIERSVNPVVLSVIVFNSQGNRTGHKTLYLNLQSKEEATKDVRGKAIFVAVLLTFFITLITFSKNLLIPFLKNIFSFIRKW